MLLNEVFDTFVASENAIILIWHQSPSAQDPKQFTKLQLLVHLEGGSLSCAVRITFRECLDFALQVVIAVVDIINDSISECLFLVGLDRELVLYEHFWSKLGRTDGCIGKL